MSGTLIIAASALLLAFVLYFEKRENPRGLVPTKGFLSFLFMAAAWVQAHPLPGYSRFMMIGLTLCLVGDVFLALPQARAFFFGLIAFLLGHISYVLAFFWSARTNHAMWVGLVLAMAMSGTVYFWLRPYLGTMNRSVLVYIAVITVMVAGAARVFGDGTLGLSGRVMVLGGAVSFYLSDVFVARDRFVRQSFLNRLVGLPLYYLGQFLLAFSLGFIA